MDTKTSESHVQKRLECSICMNAYNTTNNYPKALRCQHTFCSQCLDHLVRGAKIQCPKCRTQTEEKEVMKNFGLMEILEALCEHCHSRENQTKCDHCGSHFCSECFSDHFKALQSDTERSLTTLTKHASRMADVTSDTNAIVSESTQAAAAKGIIDEELQEKIQQLKDNADKRKQQIDEIMEENIKAYTEWREDVDMKLVKIRSFTQRAQHRLCRSNMEHSELIELQKQCSRQKIELEHAESARPKMVEYIQKTNQTPIEMEALQFTGADKRGVLAIFPDGSSDYTSVRVKRIIGERGKGPHQFNCPGAITQLSSDGCIAVTDFYNHRVKIYDDNLNLQSVFGGWGHFTGQFDELPGICGNDAGELFVSDGNNHRIQVYSRYARYLRSFGSQGNLAGQFCRPAGSVVDRNGIIYACDEHNYRVQAFMSDGKFVRMFGSRGPDPAQFSGIPVYIAIDRKDRLLVTEFGGGVKIFRMDGRFVKTIPSNLPASFGRLQSNGIAVTANGNIVIADVSERLMVLDCDGGLICTIGTRGTQTGQFNGLDGVLVTKQGDIIVCDGQNHRLQVLELSNTLSKV